MLPPGSGSRASQMEFSDDLVRHYREGNRDGDKFEKPLANSFARAIPCSRSSLSEPLFGTQTVIVINS